MFLKNNKDVLSKALCDIINLVLVSGTCSKVSIDTPYNFSFECKYQVSNTKISVTP